MRTTTTKTVNEGTRRMISFVCVILATAAFLVISNLSPLTLAKAVEKISFGNFFPLNGQPELMLTAALPQSGCITPPAGMVSWFPGDGNAQDILNNTQDLSVNGGVTFPAGKVAQAFNFDGTGEVTYSTINAGSTYTVDFWVRPAGSPGPRRELVSNHFNNGTEQYGIITFNSNSTQIEYFQAGVVRVASAPGSAPFDTYTHVALTYDGSVNRLYINGDLVSTSGAHTETFNNPVRLGSSFSGGTLFIGQIDEVEIFNRELSQSEIQSIVVADSAGKCKTPVDADGDGIVDSRDACPGTPPGTTVNAAGCPVGDCLAPPANLNNWFPGDGNPQDIQNNNDAVSVNGGVTFPAGKVAQAFNFDGTGEVTYSTINAGSTYTVDFWVRPSHSSSDGLRQELVSNTNSGPNFGTIIFNPIDTRIEYHQGGVNFRVFSAPGSAPFDTYTHVALTYDGSVNRLYINGNLASTSGVHTETFNNPILIGYAINTSNARFNGQLDEVEIFSRELSQAEVRGIFYADTAGKCKLPIDADGDGVVDNRDACPGTPLGTTVNASGCPAGACFTPPPGMTNWFPGDGNANDIQGSNNGTPNGGVTFPAGKVAQTFSFDGTGDVTYSTINVGSAYTVDFWMRPTANNSQRQEVFSNTNSGPSFGTITFNALESWIEYHQGGVNFRVFSGAGSVPFDTYTHVALTYDGSVNRLYLNGNLVSTSGVHTETFNNPVVLGYGINSPNSRFGGQLDEVEIFNRALSQTEVRGIVNADTAGKCTSTRCSPIILNPATLPAVTAGTPYSQTLTASGGESPYTFAITNGTLPPGLTLNASSGQISGTPTTPGTFNFGITATDANDCAGSRSYSIKVNCPTITLGPTSLPNGTINASYSQTITASGGASPYTFAVTSGALPPGLTLNSSTGEISGAPTTTTSSPFNFTITATDANGCTGSQAYSVAINCATITVSPASLQNGTTGAPYNQTISAAGTSGPFTFSVTSGELPPGLTLNSSTGQLSGTPTTAGPFDFTVTATDAGAGCSGSRSYTMTINDCAPTQQGLISWWRGEGNASDSAGSNSGALNGAVSFTQGQDGQAFSFNGNGFVEVPDATTLEPANVTAEAWVRHSGSPGNYKYILSKGSDWGTAASYAIYGFPHGLHFYVYSRSQGYYLSPSPGPSVWDGQWHHIVGTFDGERVRLYVDGVQVGNGNLAPITISYNLPTTEHFGIGTYARNTDFFHFPGDVDEVRIYDRALSLSEVRGNFGDCGPSPSPTPTPTPNTPPGNNVTAQTSSGDARATFTQVTDAGETLFALIAPPSSAGTPPSGYTVLNDAPAYDITTTAAYTSPVTVCFTVSSINDEAEFARVRILHGENGPLVDRTILAPDSPAPDFATRRVCARVSSLSPFVAALAPVAAPTPTPGAGPVIISEFRQRGAQGPLDEFVELYNNTDAAITVATTDGGQGWTLAALPGGGAPASSVFTIPGGTLIPARGHLLVANNSTGGYSLSTYAAADFTYTDDIPDNAHLALFNTDIEANFTAANRLDAVGFNQLAGADANLYREGVGLSVVSNTDGEYSFVRKLTTGLPQDSHDNAADLVLVSTDGGNFGGVQSILGAPGPENLTSPIQRNATIKASLIDSSQPSTAPPNRVRDTTSGGAGTPTAVGTLDIRRKFTNKTGQPITALRFRIVDVTTLNTPNPGGQQADLRLLTSLDTTANGGTITIRGTTLETPSDATIGGGLNASGVVALPGGALANGASINVRFLLGVAASGSFRFFVNVEAMNVSPPGPMSKFPMDRPGKF